MRHDSFCNLPGNYSCLQSFIYENGQLITPFDWECMANDKIAFCGQGIFLSGLNEFKIDITK